MQAPALEAFRGLSGILAWFVLLHSLWIGLAVASLTALAFRAFPRLSPQSRHGILFAALALIALGIPAIATLHYLHLAGSPVPIEPATPPMAAVAIAEPPATAPQAMSPPQPALPTEATLAATSFARSLKASCTRAASAAWAIQPFVLIAWSLAMASLGIVLVLGTTAVSRLRRDAIPAPKAVEERARMLARRLRLKAVPEVRVHAGLGEPCLCGIFRPAILLPGRWLASSRPETLDAVLAHELAHARRRDPLANLAQRALEAIFFFHPGVRWLSRSLRRQRELCADALAVRLTRNPLALARALESVARLRLASPPPRLVGASLGGEDQSLLPRIQELIGMTPTPLRHRSWPYAALPAALALALIAASTSLAYEPPHAPAEVQSERATPIPAPLPSNTDQQINYQIRFLDSLPIDWWPGLERWLKPAGDAHGNPAWIGDDKDLFILQTQMASQVTSSLIQAPTMTTFDGADASIVLPLWSEDTTDLQGLASDPATRIKLTGSLLPQDQGIRLSVDLRDSIRMPQEKAKTDKERPADQIIASTYASTIEIPKDRHLIIRLKPYTITEKYSRFFMTFTHEQQHERLVIISPKQLTVEPASAEPQLLPH